MATSNTLLGKKDDDGRPRRTRLWVILGFAVALLLAAAGILVRYGEHEALAKRTEAEAIPTLTVVHPTQGAGSDDINLPATVQAFVDAPIYARTDGYLKAWYHDIGARVKKGDLLAVIETPELDQQLEQARAAVGTARANYDLSIVTNKRYQSLVRTAAVSQQEADQSASNEAAQKAQLDAAIANVHHYEALQSFEKLYAPFDGVVTERNTDVGQLVTSGIGSGAGSGTGVSGRELFRVSSTDRLRTFIPVPQAQAVYVRDGQPADLAFVEFPGRRFSGHVARSAAAIDVNSRTMLTEVDIDNGNGQLKPGAYVTVHLKIPGERATGAVRVPSNTLIFRSKGMQLAVVGQDNTVHLREAQIGRDFGSEVEIVSGATPDDQVVVNPPDSLEEGQTIKLGQPPKEGATEAQGGQGEEKQKQDSTTNTTGSGTKPQDIKASRGSGQAEQKVSRQQGNGTDGRGGGSTRGAQNPNGMTAPGSDGNGPK